MRHATARRETVDAVLRATATHHGDVEAYVELSSAGEPGVVAAGSDGRRRMSFAQWDEAADGVAALFTDAGVGRGDVVALVLPSSIDYAVAYAAALRIGAITTGINPRLGGREQASITARTRPVVTVVDDGASGLAGVPPHSGRLIRRGELADAATRRAPRLAPLSAHDPVAVVWTSGSTGAPKGAVFDHDNLRAVAAGTDVLSQPGDRRLSPLPFSHVGYMTRLWDEIDKAITTVITPSPWSAGSSIALMASERVSVGQGVPAQWALVLEHPALAGADLSSLRVVGTGAGPVPPNLARAMRTRFGCPVVVRYTSTETSLGTSTRLEDPDEVVATTVGRPVPGVELEIAGPQGRPVAHGEVGRVRLRSGAAMRGYVATDPPAPSTSGPASLLDPLATAGVVDEDGWVTTGDLGFLGADGNLRLVGRVSEMYIRGGYNVYPAEVEAVLGEHDALQAVAVVATPDPVLGEIGVAFVVAAPDTAPPDLQDLRHWCGGRLADYKAPDRLVVVDELPLTAMAKVDKRALAARAADTPRAGAGTR